MNLKNKNIIEIVYNSPAEVFIQRHLDALCAQGITPNLIARHNDASYSKSASIQATENAPLVMPNFDRLSLVEKLFSLRYLIRSNQVSLNNHYYLRMIAKTPFYLCSAAGDFIFFLTIVYF